MRFLSNLLASTLGALLALIVVFLFGFLFLLALAASSDSTPTVPSEAVLEVHLDGPVPENAASDPLSRVFGEGVRYDLRDFRKGLRMAASDDRIRAVRLKANGAGAGWAQLEEMRTALKRYAESGKPLFATTGETGMSESDYFLASVADSVLVSPESIFEFNGFMLSSPFFEGTLQMLGIEATAVRAGEYKSAVEPFTRESYSEQNEQQLSEIVETINAVYKNGVAQSRGLSADSLEYLADNGTVFSAEDAVQAGLADALIYENEMDSLFMQRLGYNDEDDINTISLKDYARTSSSDAGLTESDGDDEIVVVYGTGQIVNEETESLGGNAEFLAPKPFREAMQETREDDDVQAVVVRIDSPGGQVAPSEAMRHEVTLTAQQKPVFVSMSNTAASGGYWLSAPADTIVADPLTLTGSIGVFAVLFNGNQFFNDKLGVTFDKVLTSPYADFSNFTTEELSEGERQLWQRFISDTYQTFTEHVAEGRGMTPDQVDSLGQGRIWTGQAAKANNLVDVLGGLDTAVRLAAERAELDSASYRVRTLPRPKSFFERYMESLNARTASLWRGWRLSDTENALLRNANRLQRLRRMHAKPMALWPYEIEVK